MDQLLLTVKEAYMFLQDGCMNKILEQLEQRRKALGLKQEDMQRKRYTKPNVPPQK